ncbi:hypothetical protein Lesp02_02850 [Lentzea sp. NBRC 105346]|uniref:hypothetical protein n=1 Tax=Lentzea sp. NBRC 105346 TaxID=3032205 RepID=UPI0024A5DB5C|nr:hypothetical protein [Lentzea sp. NBRC 105346]GLZ28095.1 hypothetical protein Lesp02_02850 [Lentzea sp. NBRC 105346]
MSDSFTTIDVEYAEIEVYTAGELVGDDGDLAVPSGRSALALGYAEGNGALLVYGTADALRKWLRRAQQELDDSHHAGAEDDRAIAYRGGYAAGFGLARLSRVEESRQVPNGHTSWTNLAASSVDETQLNDAWRKGFEAGSVSGREWPPSPTFESHRADVLIEGGERACKAHRPPD